MDMPTTNQANQDTKKQARLHLTDGRIFVLNLFGLALICAVFLCGYQYLDTYYQYHHLDSGLFPQSTTDYFVYGGYAIFRTALLVIGDGNHMNLPFLVGAAVIAAIGMALYLSLLLLLGTLVMFGVRRLFQRWDMAGVFRPLAHRLRKNQKWQTVVTPAVIIMIIFGVFLSVCGSAIIYFLVPSSIGKFAASMVLRKESEELARVCPLTMPDRRDVCMEVRDAKQQPIARGFLIAASPGYVALEEHNRVQFVSLQDRQLVQIELPTH